MDYNKSAIEDLRILSGMKIEDIELLFESILEYCIFQFAEGKKVYLPNIGELYLKYEGSELTKEGNEAQVKGFFITSDSLKKAIGEYKDAEEFGNFEDMEMVKKYFKKTNHELIEKIR